MIAKLFNLIAGDAVCDFWGNSFFPDISKCLFKSTATQRCSIDNNVGVNTSKRYRRLWVKYLPQGPYVAARVGFEHATLWTQGTKLTTEPPHPKMGEDIRSCHCRCYIQQKLSDGLKTKPSMDWKILILTYFSSQTDHSGYSDYLRYKCRSKEYNWKTKMNIAGQISNLSALFVPLCK